MNGLVLIDKNTGCTSHDVVNRWRRLAGTKRAGHLGTLDPMATGLLALVTGTATRLAQFYGCEDKVYSAEIRFGVVSDTYDADGAIRETGTSLPDEGAIRAALTRFEGVLQQVPPPVSAKKVGGVAAYKLVRKNVPVELAPVEVEVKQLEVKRIWADRLQMGVTCSAGTYIRSIAHDLGRELGCGALLASLRRTHIGGFSVERARTVEQLSELAQQGRLAEAVTPAGQLLSHIPAEYVPEGIEAQIRQGRQFRVSPFIVPRGAPLVRALSRQGELVAIGELVMPNLYHPRTVFGD